MEVLLQYLDDIDDLIGTIGLLFERLRSAFLTIVALLVAAVSVAFGVLLALVHQPIALATCLLLLVTLLYRTVSAEPRSEAQVS